MSLRDCRISAPISRFASKAAISAGLSFLDFKGTADLGQKDGGVYDWIGRAVDNEFVGFYTSAGYTGVFNMTRAK